ncbi:hypothetical protein GW17_00025249 [Ensete ventricosum]|nr:hypothetical protein GW17_00025249 [Ensete ventricosum]RZR92627.1 hypothetical protein BHM03_00020952 [Ensete ventricosum]
MATTLARICLRDRCHRRTWLPLAHSHYYMSWLLDVAFASHGCDQPLVADPRASVARCGCPRNRPNAQLGLSVAWSPLLLCTHTLLSEVLP